MNRQPATPPWAEITSYLEAKKRALYAEIRSYPTPIAGCDQQFNYLLEQLAHVSADLARALGHMAEPAEGESLSTFQSFLDSCQCIDDATRQALTSGVNMLR
jgi:hypothetical protein